MTAVLILQYAVPPSGESSKSLLVWEPDGLPTKIQIATDVYRKKDGYQYGFWDRAHVCTCIYL